MCLVQFLSCVGLRGFVCGEAQVGAGLRGFAWVCVGLRGFVCVEAQVGGRASFFPLPNPASWLLIKIWGENNLIFDCCVLVFFDFCAMLF